MKSKLATTCMITIAQRVRTRAHTLAHKPTDISIGIRWFEIEMNMCLCTLSCSTLSITERSFALQLKIDFHRNVNRLPSCWIGCFSCLILLHFFFLVFILFVVVTSWTAVQYGWHDFSSARFGSLLFSHYSQNDLIDRVMRIRKMAWCQNVHVQQIAQNWPEKET